MENVSLSVATGLTEAQAQRRLQTEGLNELATDQGRSYRTIIFEVLREPMFVMLLAAGAIYFVLGSWHEAALLSLFASFSVLITIVQEMRSENVLKALRNLTSPRALVLRDGVQKRIPGREVVRGDLIILSEGDRIPADGHLITGNDVMADESLLTGESVAVRKKPDTNYAAPRNQPGGDDLPDLFSGSLIVRGYGQAIVLATGPHSKIGQIGSALQSIEVESPHLQQETGRIVRVFGVLCFVLSTIAILTYGLLRGAWLDGLLGGIALGMSLLPEEFPLVLTVFMVMGAWRISKARVLTRRASAIETLGSATVLCTDKTGTLTENRMSLVACDVEGGAENCNALICTAALASKPETFDPMDAAILDYAKIKNVEIPASKRVHEYALRPELLAITHIIQTEPTTYRAVSKGAPEAIAGLCHFDRAGLGALHDRVRALAERGVRVLGVAEANIQDNTAKFPESPKAFSFRFCGLIGFADPLRKSVQAAVAECHAAGIRVVMITGDYPETAKAIATEAGIMLPGSNILTGAELAAMNDQVFAAHCRAATVFARIMPDQKLRIVNTLKAAGEIVAMTGDGVNDAPALKAAHIGIAMGGRGTDVAREAASIVLLDDDFRSIVRTIRLGRRIYDNLQKAMTYIIAVHVPIAGLAMLPIFFGYPLILTPLLIALMEMVIDPVCSIVLEAEEEEGNVMTRPPRAPKTPLLPASLILWAAFQGVMALIGAGGILFFALHRDLDNSQCRSLAFLALMACNFALIFVNRSYSASIIRILSRHNPWLWVSVIIVPALLGALFAIKALRDMFGFTLITTNQFLIAMIPACFLLVFLEQGKKTLSKLRSATAVTQPLAARQ